MSNWITHVDTILSYSDIIELVKTNVIYKPDKIAELRFGEAISSTYIEFEFFNGEESIIIYVRYHKESNLIQNTKSNEVHIYKRYKLDEVGNAVSVFDLSNFKNINNIMRDLNDGQLKNNEHYRP